MDNIEGKVSYPSVAQLVPTKSDHEIAAELKKKIMEITPPIFALLDEAKAAGFVIQYEVGQNAFGQHCITRLIVVKQY